MSAHRSTKALLKYLDQYAEPEAREIHALRVPLGHYGHVLCIPAHGEGEGLLRTLASVPEGPRGPVLVIVVVNETPASPPWVCAANRESLCALRRGRVPPEHFGDMELHHDPLCDLLVVDRTETGLVLPERQGVGLARKIGADAALALWAAGRVVSPWIHCSDADVSFPKDYFRRSLLRIGAAPQSEAPAALLYDFRHSSEPVPEVARAALRYESFLRYYVLGLRSAGSPYAFHTIGSTLALSPHAYAKARGFPRREASEDFHMLAKLAKLGPIRALSGEPLGLSGRVSTRVPFGTGAGIAKELERAEVDAFYPAYDPRVFAWLRVWLDTLDAFADKPLQSGRGVRELLFQRAAAEPDVDAGALFETLEGLGAVRAAEDGQGRGRRHLHERFDALRTLRFVHQLRDRHFPSIPLEAALHTAPFLDFQFSLADPDFGVLRDGLARVETEGFDANLRCVSHDVRC